MPVSEVLVESASWTFQRVCIGESSLNSWVVASTCQAVCQVLSRNEFSLTAALMVGIIPVLQMRKLRHQVIRSQRPHDCE